MLTAVQVQHRPVELQAMFNYFYVTTLEKKHIILTSKDFN